MPLALFVALAAGDEETVGGLTVTFVVTFGLVAAGVLRGAGVAARGAGVLAPVAGTTVRVVLVVLRSTRVVAPGTTTVRLTTLGEDDGTTTILGVGEGATSVVVVLVVLTTSASSRRVAL